MPMLWKPEVSDHTLNAAQEYMSLLFNPESARDLMQILRAERENILTRRANDLLRAARLQPLTLQDNGVVRIQNQMGVSGQKFSPILGISWKKKAGLEIVDGYHRLSVAYQIDPFCDVACVIAYV